MSDRFDAIVIGSGQAGNPLAAACADTRWTVAVIEREHPGGTCVNVGCTPTKTMVASARVAHLVRRAADYGVRTGPVEIDQEIIRKRKRDIVTQFSAGNRRRLTTTDGITLLMGSARFIGPSAVAVDLAGGGTRELTAPKIFINAGARPSVPGIPGLDHVRFLDSTSIMELGETPPHLIVLGGGYIGLEFGQMFRRFGSRVTIVHRGRQLLSREDQDVADEVATILRDDGIDVLLDANALSVSDDSGAIRLAVKTADGEITVTGTHLLVATGRSPNSDTLNLESAGILTDTRGFIRVNERLETNVPGIYALGDIKGGPAFTHIAYDDFRIVRANVINGGNATTEGRLVPYAVFIDPQLGRVGISETEAVASGRNYRVAKLPMTHVARALEVDEPRGVMKAIVDADTGYILGAAVLGIEGGEIVSVLQMAMMGNLPYTAIRDAVFTHPTLAESLNNLFMTIDG